MFTLFYQTILQKRTSITNIHSTSRAASELLLQADQSTPVVWSGHRRAPRLAFKYRESPNGIYYNARRSLGPAASEIGDSLRATMVSKPEELKSQDPVVFLMYKRSIGWRLGSWKTLEEVYYYIVHITILTLAPLRSTLFHRAGLSIIYPKP